MAMKDGVERLVTFLEAVHNPDHFYRQTIVLDGSKWETLEWKEIRTMSPFFLGQCRYPLSEITNAMGIDGDIQLYLYAQIDSSSGTKLRFGFEPNEPLEMEYYPWFQLSIVSSRRMPSLQMKVGKGTSYQALMLHGIESPEELARIELEFKVLAALMPSDDED